MKKSDNQIKKQLFSKHLKYHSEINELEWKNRNRKSLIIISSLKLLLLLEKKNSKKKKKKIQKIKTNLKQSQAQIEDLKNEIKLITQKNKEKILCLNKKIEKLTQLENFKKNNIVIEACSDHFKNDTINSITTSTNPSQISQTQEIQTQQTQTQQTHAQIAQTQIAQTQEDVQSQNVQSQNVSILSPIKLFPIKKKKNFSTSKKSALHLSPTKNSTQNSQSSSLISAKLNVCQDKKKSSPSSRSDSSPLIKKKFVVCVQSSLPVNTEFLGLEDENINPFLYFSDKNFENNVYFNIPSPETLPNAKKKSSSVFKID